MISAYLFLVIAATTTQPTKPELVTQPTVPSPTVAPSVTEHSGQTSTPSPSVSAKTPSSSTPNPTESGTWNESEQEPDKGPARKPTPDASTPVITKQTKQTATQPGGKQSSQGVYKYY